MLSKPIIKLRYKKDHEQIILYPHQREHVDNIINIFKGSAFAFDFSMLGTGKTFTSSVIYQNGIDIGYVQRYPHLVTIAPVSVKIKWQQMSTQYGIQQCHSLSFCELRSVKSKQPKHGLLERKDYTSSYVLSDGSTQEVDKCQFSSTEKYLSLVSDGLLLIIDEIQNIKNIGDQLNACKALIEPIIKNFESGGKSRVLLLSGSPIDKEVQVIHLFRCLNIMKSDRLIVYNPITIEKRWSGMKEIETYFANKFGEERIKQISSVHFSEQQHQQQPQQQQQQQQQQQLKFSHSALESYCYRLFQEILKRELSSSMAPNSGSVKIDKRNVFYEMETSDLNALHIGIGMLSKATCYNHINNSINMGVGEKSAIALRCIQKALMAIESSKVNLFAKIAKQHLMQHQKKKVVICVNYRATVEALMDLLEDYCPLKLDGRTDVKQRRAILAKFQTPSTAHRLLIGNMTTCSTGIDLDDQDGSYPRLCLVSPNYNTITLYQLSHRFHRANTRSDSVIEFIFGESTITELPILNALSKKSDVMRETADKQRESNVVFPGHYESWTETKDGFIPRTIMMPPNIKSSLNSNKITDDSVDFSFKLVHDKVKEKEQDMEKEQNKETKMGQDKEGDRGTQKANGLQLDGDDPHSVRILKGEQQPPFRGHLLSHRGEKMYHMISPLLLKEESASVLFSPLKDTVSSGSRKKNCLSNSDTKLVEIKKESDDIDFQVKSVKTWKPNKKGSHSIMP